MLMRDTPLYTTPPAALRWRKLVAAVLRAASRRLDGLASRLTFVRPPATAEPVLEFYGDAGAPEGALYIDGQLVGHVLGVNRL